MSERQRGGYPDEQRAWPERLGAPEARQERTA
jgi:hypothetical protein